MSYKLPTKYSFLVNNIVKDLENLCNDCGVCCENEVFMLNSFDAPIIARELEKKGGLDLLQKHIRLHERPLNIYERYLFFFDGACPFHDGKRCGFYSNRPLSCSLFPLKILAFIDHKGIELRQAVFDLHGTKSEYDCSETCQGVINKLNEIGHDSPYLSTLFTEYVAASLLTKSGYAYCFGQRRERGNKFFNPNKMKLKHVVQISEYLAEHYENVYGILPGDWRMEPATVPLSNEKARHLLSDNQKTKGIRKMKKWLRNIREFKPFLSNWRQYIGRPT